MATETYSRDLKSMFEGAARAFEQYRAGEAGLGATYKTVGEFLLQWEQFHLENPRAAANPVFTEKYSAYEAAVELAYSLGNEVEAFDYAERARARILLDQTLSKRPLRFRSGVEGEMMEMEATALREVNALARQWQDMLVGRPFDALRPTGTSSTQDKRARLERELREARGQLLAIRQSIRERDPAFAAMRGVTPASLADTQSLLDSDTALLSYCSTEDRLIIFVTTRQGLRTQHIDIRRRELGGLVSRYREAIVPGRGKNRDIVFSEALSTGPHQFPQRLQLVEQLAKELYQILIAPGLPHIRRKSRLAIVPHGDLHLLPFNALQSEDGAYLAERFAIWYSPSISVLDLCYQRHRRSAGRLLAIANPRLGADDSDLPFAEQEVVAIAPFFDARIRTGADANLTQLRALWEQTDVLHLACHAQWDAAQPEFSALLLSPSSDDTGRLEVHELFEIDHDLPLGHVTLSGCQTSMVTGNDATGLATGFLYAGAPAVVASLWRVDDQSTSELMAHFYGALSSSDRAVALQCAERALWSCDAYRDPYFWAAFKLIGSHLPLNAENTNRASAFHAMHLWTCRAESGSLVRPCVRGPMAFATWSEPKDKTFPKKSVWGMSLSERRILWKRDIPDWPRTFSFVQDLVHVEAASSIYALRASTGEIVWEHRTKTGLTQSLLFDGKYLYVGGHSRSVFALQPQTGAVRWEHELPRDASGGFALGQDMVFVGCNNQSVYAIKNDTGFLLWRYPLGRGTWDGGRWAVTADSLQTESGAFALHTGEFDPRRQIETRSPEHGRVSPEILATAPLNLDLSFHDAHLLRIPELVFTTWVADAVTQLHMFDSSGGTLLRRYDLPGRGISGMSSDGKTLMVGDAQGALHCFSLAKPGSEPES